MGRPSTTMRRILAYAVARRLGLPVVVDEGHVTRYTSSSMTHAADPKWNAERQVLLLHPSYDGDLLHEIAHFLVATPDQRRRDDWGLPGMGREDEEQVERETDVLQRALEKVMDAALCELGQLRLEDLR